MNLGSFFQNLALTEIGFVFSFYIFYGSSFAGASGSAKVAEYGMEYSWTMFIGGDWVRFFVCVFQRLRN